MEGLQDEITWSRSYSNRTRVTSVYFNIFLNFYNLIIRQTSEVRIDILMLPSILMNAYLICVHLYFYEM